MVGHASCCFPSLLNTTNSGNRMNHQQLEIDIRHLERLIPHISLAPHLPLSYWQSRVDSISFTVRVPEQARRVKRLLATLTTLAQQEKR